MMKIPSDGILEDLYKLGMRESEKQEEIRFINDKLKEIVKRRIEQNLPK